MRGGRGAPHRERGGPEGQGEGQQGKTCEESIPDRGYVAPGTGQELALSRNCKVNERWGKGAAGPSPGPGPLHKSESPSHSVYRSSYGGSDF